MTPSSPHEDRAPARRLPRLSPTSSRIEDGNGELTSGEDSVDVAGLASMIGDRLDRVLDMTVTDRLRAELARDPWSEADVREEPAPDPAQASDRDDVQAIGIGRDARRPHVKSAVEPRPNVDAGLKRARERLERRRAAAATPARPRRVRLFQRRKARTALSWVLVGIAIVAATSIAGELILLGRPTPVP